MSLTMELPCPDCGSDEVVCVVCGPLEKVAPWRNIDPDDPETWPIEACSVWLALPPIGGRIGVKHAYWRGEEAFLYTHWMPADIPEPPTQNNT